MNAQQPVSCFSDTAFRAAEIGPLPKSPEERVRIGEELQPTGSYAFTIPYQGTVQDIEVLQDHEKQDPQFCSNDWWWDHQRIRFLNEKLGLKVLILLVPMLWILTLVVGPLWQDSWHYLIFNQLGGSGVDSASLFRRT